MTIAAYVRVSSKSQDHASQRDAIERAAKAQGVVISEWYSEKMSAKTMVRPELQRLRDAVRAGKIERLLVFKLDRMVRSGVADAFAIVAELRRSGVTLFAVADHLTISPDKDDVTSEVLVFALGLAAKLERAAIAERVAAARTRVEAEGGHWGRPHRMSPAETDRARAMHQEGRSVRQIAIAMKVPRSTIGRALSQNTTPADDPTGTPDPAPEHSPAQ